MSLEVLINLLHRELVSVLIFFATNLNLLTVVKYQTMLSLILHIMSFKEVLAKLLPESCFLSAFNICGVVKEIMMHADDKATMITATYKHAFQIGVKSMFTV